jgi:hypothetical protein
MLSDSLAHCTVTVTSHCVPSRSRLSLKFLFLHVYGINFCNIAELENLSIAVCLHWVHVYRTESVTLQNVLLSELSAFYVRPRGVSYIIIVLKTAWVFLYSCSIRAGSEVKNKLVLGNFMSKVICDFKR